mmetsp:Transcript_12416/g.21019  ORF Transcript_12416/g.21019 Transcript_12416/m.21019 type:complete len:132 (-) Transcript_12416:273-668(-)
MSTAIEEGRDEEEEDEGINLELRPEYQRSLQRRRLNATVALTIGCIILATTVLLKGGVVAEMVTVMMAVMMTTFFLDQKIWLLMMMHLMMMMADWTNQKIGYLLQAPSLTLKNFTLFEKLENCRVKCQGIS